MIDTDLCDSTERPVEKVETIVKGNRIFENKVKVWVDFFTLKFP